MKILTWWRIGKNKAHTKTFHASVHNFGTLGSQLLLLCILPQQHLIEEITFSVKWMGPAGRSWSHLTYLRECPSLFFFVVKDMTMFVVDKRLLICRTTPAPTSITHFSSPTCCLFHFPSLPYPPLACVVRAMLHPPTLAKPLVDRLKMDEQPGQQSSPLSCWGLIPVSASVSSPYTKHNPSSFTS